MLARFKNWLYSQNPFPFDADGISVTRAQAWQHGGPAPQLNSCSLCQRLEYQARVMQKAIMPSEHTCAVSDLARLWISIQGNPQWIQYHQNFHFIEGFTDVEAKRILCLFDSRSALDRRYRSVGDCDHVMHTLRRMLSRIGQIEITNTLRGIDWSRYDALLLQVRGEVDLPALRPPVKVFAIGHDLQHEGTQASLDFLCPDVLFSSSPLAWQSQWHIPSTTQVVYHPLGALDSHYTWQVPVEKRWDLLVPGARNHETYAPRRQLDDWLKSIADFTLNFHTHAGHHNQSWYKQTYGVGDTVYLNGFSRLLSQARYVTFGGNTRQILVGKTLDCLGSGAVSILPDVPDMIQLSGLHPWEHYIPAQDLVKIEDWCDVLRYYPQFYPIGRAGKEWHSVNIDMALYDSFEQKCNEVL